MIENTNTKQFYPGPILNNTLEITDFLFNDAEQIKIKHSKLNGEGILVNIDLNYPTDYEVIKVLPSDVNAAEAALTASTGQIILKNINVLTGERLTVYRVSQIVQNKDYPRTGAFPAATHEGALDYLTMQNQEQGEELARSLKVPISTPNFNAAVPIPLPNRILRINEEASGFEFVPYDLDERLDTFENNISNKASNAETIANSANTKSENAVTTANTAFNTSTAALNTSNEAKVIAQNAVTTANTTVTRVDEFENDINTVIEAAEIVNTLENSVNIAVQAAEEATNAANTAVTTLSNKVNKAGDTMTGNLVIRKENGYIAINDTSLDTTTIPATTTTNLFALTDRNNRHLANVRFQRDTDGTQSVFLLAHNGISGTEVTGIIGVSVDRNGNVYTQAPTPATGDNSTKIANTAWVNSGLDDKVNIDDMVEAPLVDKNGDTMTGNLTINKAQGNFIIKEPNLDYTTIPSSESISSFRLTDKNSFALGDVRFTRTTSGEQTTTLYARNKVSGTDKSTTIVAGVSATGNRYVNLNTDVINVNGEVMPYVKLRIGSGTLWYEVWSDGTIKQGGQVLLTPGAGLKTFNLAKDYTTDTYILTGICKFNDGVDGNGSDQSYVNAVRLSSQTTSTFTLQSAMGEATYFNWEATGK